MAAIGDGGSVTTITRELVRCSCGCTVLALDAISWEGASPDEVYVDLYTHYGPMSLSHRASTAWRVLRGKDHYLDALALGRAEVEQLQEALANVLVGETPA